MEYVWDKDSEDTPSDPSVHEAWEDEIKARIDAVRSGSVEGVPFEVAMKEAERLFHG